MAATQELAVGSGEVEDTLLRHGNLAAELLNRLVARAIASKSEFGRLGTERLRHGTSLHPFHYRVESRGDRGVVRQVLRRTEYSVAKWKHGNALQRFYAAGFGTGKELLVVDAGANIGAASIYFQLAYPGCRVVAIEPERRNCELLRLNAKGMRIDVLEAALGGSSGTLYLQDLGRSDWGFQVAETGLYPVRAWSMEELMAEYVPRTVPFILKIDIEGAEEQLFAGPCGWLEAFPLVAVELHDWMSPGKALSRSFYQRISEMDFDIVNRGENTFCFNNSLLRAYY